MIILEDSRQQESKHKIKHKWCLEHGVHWNRSALQCGDYQLPRDGSVAIDTKKDIQELIGDIQFNAMSQKDIRKKLSDIGNINGIPEERMQEIFELIVADDSDRFAEKQISDYCFRNGIPEGALKEFQNLYVKRHGFFHRGIVRAKNYGVKLYILVDNKDGVADIDSLFRWVNPRRKIYVGTNEVTSWTKNGNPRYKKVQKYPNCMMGEQLAKACITMEKKYGCTFLFCRPEEAAPKIIKLLSGRKEMDEENRTD